MIKEKSKLPEPQRLARNKYNRENYSQPKVSIRKDLLERFAAACKKANVPQARVIRDAMLEFIYQSKQDKKYRKQSEGETTLNINDDLK